jgi:preprotein translocase subunit SecD
LRQNVLTWLIGIVILAMVAGYVDLSTTIGFGHDPPLNGEFARDVRPHLGLDLRGGLQMVLQALPRGDKPITSDQLQAARDIIEQRANGIGASEPVVQTAGTDRILVELPGLENLEEATQIIGETAFLEYINGEATYPNPCTGCEVGELVTTTEGAPSPQQLRAAFGTPTSVPATATAVVPVTGTATISSTTTVTATGTNTSTTGSTQPTPAAAPTPPTHVFQTIITGDKIDGNKVSVVFDQANQPQVQFFLTGDGPSKLADFTSTHVGVYMPIVLDKKVISSPRIQSAITGGNGVITGMTLQEAQKLAIQLKYGALPVSLQFLESRKISATLGQDAINKSVVAGTIGLGLVILFMIVYYRLPGMLASVALLVYAAVTYAVFKLVPVTLTLAGIAGFILSIGMAVDANVLIFSRLKEELRSGKTLAAAVEAGFDHAWPSIRDSNMSTLITCAILFWFGSQFGGASIIKGFALTLAIGVAISLFSAITVTRTFLRAIVSTPLSKSRWAFHLEERPTVAPATTVTEP